MLQDDLNRFVSGFLDHSDFEELLEHFDLTPEAVFTFLYESGYIDDDLLEELRSI